MAMRPLCRVVWRPVALGLRAYSQGPSSLRAPKERLTTEPTPPKQERGTDTTPREEGVGAKRSKIAEKIQQRAQKKAALTLTPQAVEHIRALLHASEGPKLLRVGVRNKGCAGMSYHLEYVTPGEEGRFDERVQQDGVEVLIDSRALFSIIGSVMDWQEDRMSAKFVFQNPNIKDACGCGESFMV
ncbi:Iron-sulfur assembly protein 1 [Malassezia nana]|uniref:Iron-sulfur assembly protein 1 n=1 Tax=Malassezia nana TaxID=180528 RepID=A0AAF0J203_9BASI|nr:Iron-sulfur assembly protein 1 [Malassezia nana]